MAIYVKTHAPWALAPTLPCHLEVALGPWAQAQGTHVSHEFTRGCQFVTEYTRGLFTSIEDAIDIFAPRQLSDARFCQLFLGTVMLPPGVCTSWHKCKGVRRHGNSDMRV